MDEMKFRKVKNNYEEVHKKNSVDVVCSNDD